VKSNRKLDFTDCKILNSLKNNKDIKICRFDKGKGFVILNSNDYDSKMLEILNTNKFKKMKEPRKSPSIGSEDQLNKLLSKLKYEKLITAKMYDVLRCSGSQPCKIYGLPKVHKDNVPLRPVLSMIGSAQYKVAKFLDNLIKPLIQNDVEIEDTFKFVSLINNMKTKTDHETMVSFDVSSLFTNVPVSETIDYVTELWLESDGSNIINCETIKQLLEFCCTNVPFMYGDNWFMQVDGVAMGSPLAPTLASLFMKSIEDKLSTFTGNKPSFFKRYVDDTFAIFDSPDDVDPFFRFLNELHPNIKFTLENEEVNCLNFLDVKVRRVGNNYTTSTFYKKTDTGLYTTPNSYCDGRYKKNLMDCLIHRIYNIGSNYNIIHNDLNVMCDRLKKNGYKENIIEKRINKYFKNVKLKKAKDERKYKYIKLPFSHNSKNMKSIFRKIFKDEVRIIFISKKSGDYFYNKSTTQFSMRSNVVYQYTCHACSASYVGETSRHLVTRIREHGQPSRKSYIYQHLCNCGNDKGKVNINEFKIVNGNFNGYYHRVAMRGFTY